METAQQSQANVKKREWIKGLLKMSEDEKSQEAFQKFQSNFNGKLYDYSFSNWMGLVVQTWSRGSYAFQFGSFNKWKSLKRFVKKGEKGMSVLVPVTIPKKDENGNPVMDTKTGKPATFTYYTIKNGVFSIDQTEGTDGKTFVSFRTVENFADDMFDKLHEKVVALYPVRSMSLSTGTGGYTDGKEIVLNSERDKVSQFVTLIHELSHNILEHTTEEMRDKLTSIDKETEAELSTLIYCTLSGIFAKGSAFYLQSVDFDKVDIARINRAIKSAGKIYEMVHGKKQAAEKVA